MNLKPIGAIVAFALASCAGGSGTATLPQTDKPSSEVPAQVSTEAFSLHPARIHFAPKQTAKREYVHGYGEHGSFTETCSAQGIAEVAGDGLKGSTGIFDVIPFSHGHCTATFRNGQGQQLTLHVSVAE